jgi:predicted transglutaminase-like protease
VCVYVFIYIYIYIYLFINILFAAKLSGWVVNCNAVSLKIIYGLKSRVKTKAYMRCGPTKIHTEYPWTVWQYSLGKAEVQSKKKCEGHLHLRENP